MKAKTRKLPATTNNLPAINNLKKTAIVKKTEALEIVKKNSAPSVETVSLVEKRYIMVPDTNVLIDAPDSIIELRKGGNLLVITITVLLELNGLKNSPGIGPEVREAIRIIKESLRRRDSNIVLEKEMDFSGINFDKSLADNRIIATLNYIVGKSKNRSSCYYGYDGIKMITNDNMVEILSRFINQPEKLIIEDYRKSQVKINQRRLNVPILKMSGLSPGREYFPVSGKSLRALPDNSLVIGYQNKENSKKGELIAIKRGGQCEVFSNEIRAYGISAMHNGSKNWEQIAALHLLLDQSVPCVIMQGGAGTGKTLLSLAAGLHQKGQEVGRYSQIIISRPAVPLDPDQQLGFLPGDIYQKMNPWILPIVQNLQTILKERSHAPQDLVGRFSSNGSGSGRKSQEVQENGKPKMLDTFAFLAEYGIFIQPLDSIRGATFCDSFIIIDEAQNLTRHQAKTIATRVGKNTKIIFNGDLSQIDNRHLTKATSGLAYLMSRFAGSSLVGIINFKETLRSPFSSLAERLL